MTLHEEALIILDLREQRDAIVNPWRFAFQQPDQPESPLPLGTSITKVYEDAGGELLILGEPGSGKTTLLLKLTRNLLDHAEQDDKLQIPVVFNLSSWATKQQSLAQWLVEELMTKYQVPRKLGQAWVNNDQILPLLDGLDEVTSNARTACVEAINTYRQEHMVPTVVCSRRTEYLTQTKRVVLRNAVVVQPLTIQQIDAYLESAGEQAKALCTALRQDADLRELATTPLMLTILVFAYGETSPGKISGLTSLGAKREQIFASYVQHMLKRRGASKRYKPEQITHWLTYLAQQMKQQNQTLFYIEQMQPNWLPEGRLSQAYERLAVWLPGMLIGVLGSLAVTILLFGPFNPAFAYIIFGLLGGLIGGLFSGRNIARQSAERRMGSWKISWHHFIVGPLRNGLLVGLSSGLIVGLNAGPSYGLISGLTWGLSSVLLSVIFKEGNAAQPQTERQVESWRSLWRRLVNAGHVWNASLVVLITGLIFGLSNGLQYGLIGIGLIGFLLSVILVGRDRTIQPAEIIVWSWRSIWQSLINGRHVRNALLVGLSFGLLGGLSNGLISGLSIGLTWGLSFGSSFGLIYWLLLGLFNGLSSDTLDEHHRIMPNEGIRRSAQNALLVGLVSGFVSSLIIIPSYGLSFGLLGGLHIGLLGGLRSGLGVGLAVGLLAGLLNGGLACIRHGVCALPSTIASIESYLGSAHGIRNEMEAS